MNDIELLKYLDEIIRLSDEDYHKLMLDKKEDNHPIKQKFIYGLERHKNLREAVFKKIEGEYKQYEDD